MSKKVFIDSFFTGRLIDVGGISDIHLCVCDDYDMIYKRITNPNYAKLIENNINNLSQFYGDSDIVFPYKTVYFDKELTKFDGYLMDWLYKYDNLDYNMSLKDKINILNKTRDVVEKLHNEYNIIHTDLNPKNIMYKKDIDKVALIDLDLSIDEKSSELFDSRHYHVYVADYLKSNSIDYNIDTYLFNLLTYAFIKNMDYECVLDYINVTKDLGVSDKATSILKSYTDIGCKKLKKEYIIDYL